MTNRALALETVLESLKDFQLNTARYVFRTLVKDPEGSRRFLVADEVGLGKTLVARGVIAQVIDHLSNSERIDIVYVCSNKDIARQNIRRLNTAESDGFSLATRLTLLGRREIHGGQADFRNNRLNFISITPGTSFNQEGTRLGERAERVLLYHLLRDAWDISGAAPSNVLKGNANADRFRDAILAFPNQYVIDTQIRKDFIRELRSKELNKPVRLETRFRDLCAKFPNKNSSGTAADREERNQLIGEFRSILARVSLRVLSPDLVILDEFQRFRHLLRDDNAAGELAHELFNFSDAESKAHVLLLSATPYKMYTVQEEAAQGDDHYQDFLATTSFLMNCEASEQQLSANLASFRHELLRQVGEPNQRLRELRTGLEHILRGVMSRTERLGQKLDRNGMLKEVRHSCSLDAMDMLHYTGLQEVARIIEVPDVIEYWQSAPYLLNFMDDYELKRDLLAALQTPDKAARLRAAFKRHPEMMLMREQLDCGDAIPVRNPRLRSLYESMIESGAWQLLWTPPALPCYRLEGPFAPLAGFTKRLIFSAWRVVPKAIACLLSHEAERRAQLALREKLGAAAPDERQAQSGLLRFSKTGGRLTGMPIFTLIYPSTFLSTECDPQKLQRMCQPGEDSLANLLDLAEDLIAQALQPMLDRAPKEGPRDEAWYWAAPLLLDEAYQRAHGGTPFANWWQQDSGSLQSTWTGDQMDNDDPDSAWLEHVEQLRSFALGQRELGVPPPDLARVLALTGIASPANCAARALSRISGLPTPAPQDVRDAAARMAWAFRLHFNRPHAITIIRSVGQGDVYWESVLDYCAQGCLQAMLDEYGHVLRESLGLIQKTASEVVGAIAETVISALSLRPANLSVDFPNEINERGTVPSGTMVSRFALQLSESKDKAETPEDGSRLEKVREAFNSPFWPFVVASTSVGQEGVDFHTYCHAIMHWNLPGNPVDMEQREGRIHRYKGHAVRKNLAARYANSVIDPAADVWEQMFAAAVRARSPEQNDLYPYWIFPLEGGASIERHVVAPPLSREEQRLADTRRTLALYRMVFGQPRQDDLVQFLKQQREDLSEAELESITDELRIDLTPPASEAEHQVEVEVVNATLILEDIEGGA